uniref:Peptidase M1 membrane alanine aminopeptidase domain-containing protein n=1 Tax=Anisakis simplex TaxID=6269 RepID=A0A0M3JI88_ANISI
LWNAHSEASGQDVKTLMSSWTKQMGFPLVSVQQTVDGNKRVLKLTQKRFIADGTADENNSVWQQTAIFWSSGPAFHCSLVIFEGANNSFNKRRSERDQAPNVDERTRARVRH